MKTDGLYETVRAYGKEAVPMHMPGHKRNVSLLGSDLPYDADITEIDGFDNLHAPEEDGLLSRLSERAAALYGARHTFPLVNGTTCGILASIRAAAEPNSAILIARNCHKSVYHAIELTGLRHVCLLPPTDAATGIYGSIRPSDVEDALTRDPAIRTVVVTSPTYEGVTSDVDAIAEIVHRHGARLIVDGAHGAHLGFSSAFPAFPRRADIVVTSLHKTLPSLTQTALALTFSEDEALAERLARELSVFETSSPSYVLLASIDRCVTLLRDRADTLFCDYARRLDAFYEGCRALKRLTLLTGDRTAHPAFYGFDRGKLLILTNGAMSGTELASRLRHTFHIEPEMAYADYVLCMTSICDSDESLERLLHALHVIDASLSPREAHGEAVPSAVSSVLTALPRVVSTVKEAIELPASPLKVGEPARVYAWVYPPGVPLVVPGEEVTENTLLLLERLKSTGLTVRVGR